VQVVLWPGVRVVAQPLTGPSLLSVTVMPPRSTLPVLVTAYV